MVSAWLKLSLVTCLTVNGSLAAGYESLFDGKTLNGWKTDGKAEWSVEQGAIVGRQGSGTAAATCIRASNGLTSTSNYSSVCTGPPTAESGFAAARHNPVIRRIFSTSRILLIPSADRLLRWGQAFHRNCHSRNVKKQGWNDLHIKAIGDSIVIFVNGKQVVSAQDSKFLKPGSIGIEVHPGTPFKGMEIRVRHVRLKPM